MMAAMKIGKVTFDIDKMTAGQLISALISKKIFKCNVIVRGGLPPYGIYYCGCYRESLKSNTYSPILAYSEDMRCAFSILEELIDHNPALYANSNDDCWECDMFQRTIGFDGKIVSSKCKTALKVIL